jgi:hypothetical protein
VEKQTRKAAGEARVRAERRSEMERIGRCYSESVKHLRLPLALFAALLVVPAAPGAAFDDEEEITRLEIEVKSLTGKPVDRASVVVKFSEGRSIAKLGKKIRTSFELRTNQEGVARVPAIPRGKILIQVIASGYQTFGEVFDVQEASRKIEIRLKPPQAQYSSH